MILERCPSFVQRMLVPCGDSLSRPQRVHLNLIVLAMAVTWGRSKLSHLATLARSGHRTSVGRFFSRAPWQGADALDQQVMAMLKKMKPRAGETLDLLIDDTRIAKRGKQMAALSKIFDYKQRRFTRGHIVVLAALRFRGVVLPWRVELWLPRTYASEARYRKTTQIAAALIESLPSWLERRGVKVRVLFDAFYLCPKVTKACESRGFAWFSVAAGNRNFQSDTSRRQAKKLGVSAPGWLRHDGRRVRLKRSRSWRPMRITKRVGHLSRIGRVAIAVSKRDRDPWKKVLCIATNQTKLNARAIVSAYESRWDIEVLFKQLRHDLGLCDYQMLDEQGIVNHLHLVCLAHLLLTHHAMDCVGVQAWKRTDEVTLPSMQQRLAALRADLRKEQLKRVCGTKHRSLRMKLEPLLLAA